MKLHKQLILVTALIFLAAALLPASTTHEQYKFDQLLTKAQKNGAVRVMVHLNVPGIDLLSRLSAGFRTGNLNKSNGFSQHAYNADLELEEAIAKTRYTVLQDLKDTQFTIKRTYSAIPYMAVITTPSALERLKNLPQVLSIEEDQLFPVPLTEQSTVDPTAPDLSSPKLSESTQIIGADTAWGFGYDGTGWYVAVLDTGIRAGHEMFQGKSIVEHCFASGEDLDDGNLGDCPNGLNEMDGAGSAMHYNIYAGHGSHVAGIAAGNNHNNLFGVARGAGIVAVNVFSYFSSYNDVLSWGSDQIKGMDYIYSLRNMYNIASVNLSLGSAAGYYSYCTDSSRQAIVTMLRNAGIATVIASGNESRCGAVADPACVIGAVSVSGTTKQDGVYYAGNWHDEMVTLLAPGDSINSAFSTGNSDYSYKSGTSMSTPHVAGAFAVLKQFDPTFSVDELVQLFIDSGKMIDSTRCSGLLPKPRISVGDALMSLLSIVPPLNYTAHQVSNHGFLNTEYINVLTWEANPLNQNKNVTVYKIYISAGDQLTFLAQVDSSTFSYQHRNVAKNTEITYGITAVDDQGEESPPNYYTLEFNIQTQ